MNLLDRLKLLVQSTVNGAVEDLIGDDTRRSTAGPISTSTADTDKLLRQAHKRLETLRDDLAGAAAREKRTEQAWREAGAKAADLNAEVDGLLRNNQNDEARAKLQQAQRAAQQTADLEQELQRFAKLSVELREEIAMLEDQLGQIRQRMQQTDPSTPPAPPTPNAPAREPEQRQQPQPTPHKNTAPVTPPAQTQPPPSAPPEVKRADAENVGAEDVKAEDGMDSSRMADVLKKLQEQRNQQNNKS